MVGKTKKEDEFKHLKNRREEQKTKKVLAQQAATKNTQKQPGGGRGPSTKNRGGNPPNVIRKTPNCVLCKSLSHWTKQHNFQIHGNFTHQSILDNLRQNKLCFRCALPLTNTHKFQQCSNPISQCEHCASFNHISLCCKNRKNILLDLRRIPFDPKTQAHRNGPQEVVQID